MKRLTTSVLNFAGFELSRLGTIASLRERILDKADAVEKLTARVADLEARAHELRPQIVYDHKMWFDPLDVAMNLSLLRGLKPSGEAAYILKVLKEGQTALDIGANVGVLSLLMARAVGPTGQVYAFEPGPRAFQFLRMNVDLNDYKNIVAENVAVSDRTGETELQVCMTGESDNRLAGITAADNYLRFRVNMTTVDSYLDGRRVDLIKVDVQGSEYAVLQGMRNTVAANPSLQIIMEYGPAWVQAAGVEPAQFFSLIENLGLKMYDLPDQGPEIPVTVEWLEANIGAPPRTQTNLILRRN